MISGLSFYDCLNKLVVGTLVLMLFVNPIHNDEPMFYIVAFLVGIIYQFVVKGLTPFLTNTPPMIKQARNEVYGDVLESNLPEKRDGIMNDYFLAYYNVAKHGLLRSITVLEATENFLRNMFPMTGMYLVSLLAGSVSVKANLHFLGSAVHVSLFLFLLFLIMPFVWYHTQMKIHKLVWEGQKYLQKLDGSVEVKGDFRIWT